MTTPGPFGKTLTHIGATLFAVLGVCGCTMRIDTAKLLNSDDAVRPLDMAALDPGDALRAAGAHLEPLDIRHADGVMTRGIHLIKPNSKVVIVYLTGNKMRLNERGAMLLPRFAQLDADLMWMDYRGQGASEGQPSFENLLADAAELLAVADRLNKTVVVHGLSMGSLLATRTAQSARVSGLVLEGPITTVPQVVEATTPGWLRTVLTIDIEPTLAAIDNTPLVAGFDRPLLILVGQKDSDTPPVLSERLYRAAVSGHKDLLLVPKAEHGDVMTHDAALAVYRRFLVDVVQTH